MPTSRKLLLIDIGVKLLIVGIITVWLTLIYTIATSEADEIRRASCWGACFRRCCSSG